MTVALKDINAGDELYADYGSGYFDDLEGECPCHSCNAQTYKAIEEEEYKHQNQQHEKEEIDRVVIAEKKRSEIRRGKRNKK